MDIDDVYARPNFLLSAGEFWPPKYTPDRQARLEVLYQMAVAEHSRVRKFYTGKDIAILGNTLLYDTAIGWLNLIQALRVGVYHDAYHFALVRRILAGC